MEDVTDCMDANKTEPAVAHQAIVRQPTEFMDKFEVADDFCNGMVAALQTVAIDPAESDHWNAGYSAGYAMKADRDRRLNEYLQSIGVEKIGTVRLV